MIFTDFAIEKKLIKFPGFSIINPNIPLHQKKKKKKKSHWPPLPNGLQSIEMFKPSTHLQYTVMVSMMFLLHLKQRFITKHLNISEQNRSNFIGGTTLNEEIPYDTLGEETWMGIELVSFEKEPLGPC